MVASLPSCHFESAYHRQHSAKLHHMAADPKRSISPFGFGMSIAKSSMAAVTLIRARRPEKGLLSNLSLEDRLRSHSFGSGLPPAAIRMLAGIAKPCDFKAGEYLWKQGDHAKVLYLIDSGQIALEILVPHQGPLQIETVGAGEVLGWSCLLEPYRWHFDARTMEDVSALVLEGQHLRQECDDQPAVGYRVLKQLTPLLEVRLQKMRLRILELNGHWSR